MDERLFTLTYVSRAVDPFSLVELGELMEQCQVHNAGIGVTGILVYREPTLFQILEGDKSAVLRLFEAIARDPRHRDVVRSGPNHLSRRRCPQWSMNLITEGELYDVLGSSVADLRTAISGGSVSLTW